MTEYKRQPGTGYYESLESFYSDIQAQILDTSYREKDYEVTGSDIWEIIIREGLYQNLVENPSVAIGFFLITDRGPTGKYREYLNLADNYSDVLVLVATSALVNDTLDKKDHYVSDELNIYDSTYKQYEFGDMANLSGEQKKERADVLFSSIDSTLSEGEIIESKSSQSNSDSGLYNHSLIDYLYTNEDVKFVFKKSELGYSAGEEDSRTDPTDNGRSYTVITDTRIITIVGKGRSPDRILSIPIFSIKQVEQHVGLTKDRIELSTKCEVGDGTYHIWVRNMSEDAMEALGQ